MRRDELGQVMDHSGITTGLNERKLSVQVFSQHHGAIQPQTVIPWLTITPLRLHTTCTDHHQAWEKQPAKADYSSVADSDCEIC